MLTVEKFKERMMWTSRSDWLRVAVDADSANQFYIVGNGGMGNMISMHIESYLPEIKTWVIREVNSGELIIDEQKNLLLDRGIFIHYLSLIQYN